MKKVLLLSTLLLTAGFVYSADMAAGSPATAASAPVTATGPATTTAAAPAASSAPVSSALCTLSPASGSKVAGWVKFTQGKGYVLVEGDVTGLTPGKHGFHIHDKGDCSAPDATSAGGHFNPTNQPHGAPNKATSHMGDLGNITADGGGHAKFKFKNKIVQLSGDNTIVGRAVIVHAKLDDEKTQPTGNAGARVACGVIEAAN